MVYIYICKKIRREKWGKKMLYFCVVREEDLVNPRIVHRASPLPLSVLLLYFF